MDKLECNHCGQCCQFTYNGIKYNCPYLEFDENNKSSCSIYENRIGTIIFEDKGKSLVCGYRKDQDFLIDDCPYNELITPSQKRTKGA